MSKTNKTSKATDKRIRTTLTMRAMLVAALDRVDHSVPGSVQPRSLVSRGFAVWVKDDQGRSVPVLTPAGVEKALAIRAAQAPRFAVNP